MNNFFFFAIKKHAEPWSKKSLGYVVYYYTLYTVKLAYGDSTTTIVYPLMSATRLHSQRGKCERE